MRSSRTRIAAAAAFGTFLTACSVLPRLDAVPAADTERATVLGIPNARFWLDGDLGPFVASVIGDNQREKAALAAAGKPIDALPAIYSLAISGGGDRGAFGAGVLNGWTARGDRPEFKVVTGISAGGLLAPFAFLGPRYDDVIRTVATTLQPGDIFWARNSLAGLASDGMADSEPLARLVEKYVTPELLAEIAAEFGKGRVLEIQTTDLDAGRAVTWNMGAIAASKASGALELFRKIMIASTSIPGVVSPVMIDVEVNGKTYQEMHVDGGVISQVFLYPRRLLQEFRKATGHAFGREAHTYIIRNGRLEPDWQATPRRTLAILERSMGALVQQQGIGDVDTIYRNVRDDKLDFNVAYIDADFEYPHPEEFDRAYMKQLYDYGYRLALGGRAWHKTLGSEAAPEAH